MIKIIAAAITRMSGNEIGMPDPPSSEVELGAASALPPDLVEVVGFKVVVVVVVVVVVDDFVVSVVVEVDVVVVGGAGVIPAASSDDKMTESMKEKMSSEINRERGFIGGAGVAGGAGVGGEGCAA